MTTGEIVHTVASTDHVRSWAASYPGLRQGGLRPACVNRPDLGLWVLTHATAGGEAAAASLSALPMGLDAAAMLTAVRAHGAAPGTVAAALMTRNGHVACLSDGTAQAFLWRAGTVTKLVPMDRAGSWPSALQTKSGPMAQGDRYALCNDALLRALGEAAAGSLLGADEDAPAERMVLAAMAAGAVGDLGAVTVQMVQVADARGS